MKAKKLARAIFAQATASDWREFSRFWLGVSLTLHLCSAVWSVGYHSADEYFQILEFLNFKLGATPERFLAVEFPERMRPWLQPGIYYCLVRLMQFLGDQNPFHWSIGIRLLTGLVGWLSLTALARCLPDWFRAMPVRRAALLALTLLWYLPALHVRPSSESWGGSFFAIGLSALHLSRGRMGARWGLAIGACMGLAFEFRFQIGIMVAGAFLWALWDLLQSPARLERAWFPWLLGWVSGFALAFVLGRSVDAWGYGQWVLSPWNYVHYNLIRDEVNRFGRSPWWDVFRMATTEAWPVLGTLVIGSFVLAWIRHPRHLLTWALAPFFVVHCVISHKELRFFFPIASVGAPLFVLAFYDAQSGDWIWRRFWKKHWPTWAQVVLVLLTLNNTVGLISGATLPMARSVAMYEEIWNTGTQELWTLSGDPFDVLGTPTFFYRRRELRVRQLPTPKEALEALGESGATFYLTSSQFPPEWSAFQTRCRRIATLLPPVVDAIRDLGWLPHTNSASLWSCKR